MRRAWLTAAVVAVLAAVISAGPAAADPIPGATYQGTAADGAAVYFTVSSDGTIVDSYSITRVTGKASGGGTCQFVAEGKNGVWEGAPIDNNAFQYTLGDAILFQGTFNGVRTVSGTFRLYTHANQSQSCDTGVVSWTATTSASPPPGSGGSGGGGSGGGGNGHKHRFVTWITLRKASSKRLAGQIRSPSRSCRVRRTVVLWQGKHRIDSIKSNARGKFSFARTASMHGRPVRASTPARTMPAGMCAAGSSTFIRG